ncbi:hypothetical protein NAC44_17365 [Allorhizobium sp. BGMRC 0089]|uniref:hypothetical protein n=1 Tax=Allorhizobium sonneratiae TaxID=2934936 RepID=UPI002033F95E|nr:hypothetical protein [Allorhizobium sonneratiae]MCM2294099.1 hypothetical protein [Allorhizobium sonneratiae]
MNEFVDQRSLFRSVPRFTIGRDQHGCWVLQDTTEKLGGLFASEEAALKFISKECKDHLEDIRRAPASMTVELMSGEAHFSSAA